MNESGRYRTAGGLVGSRPSRGRNRSGGVVTPLGSRVRKAVFPVADLDTGLLPATKAAPREMLSIVDKPLIQYAVEEAVAAGIRELIFVTSRSKRSIEDHFDSAFELEARLRAQDAGRLRELQEAFPEDARCLYVRQPEGTGIVAALQAARPLIGAEPFAVICAEHFIDEEVPALADLLACYDACTSPVVGVTPARDDSPTGFRLRARPMTDRWHAVEGVAQGRCAAEGELIPAGRYVLTGQWLAALPRDIDSIMTMLEALRGQHDLVACELEGRHFACDTKLGMLEATVHVALQHPEVGAPFRRLLDHVHRQTATGVRGFRPRRSSMTQVAHGTPLAER